MRRVREIMRLRFELGLSQEKVAQSCNVGRSTVGDCLQRIARIGLSWPLAEELGDLALENLVYGRAVQRDDTQLNLPDWGQIHQELKRKGVTRSLLWQEYRQDHPTGLEYSSFCERYRNWSRGNRISMRQHHKAGEKLFVDYAGQGIAIQDPRTGVSRSAEIFVAVWGASNYTFAEATWSQKLPDWIASHTRAFDFFGCIPRVVVPDCLKSAIKKACRYQPETNPTYAAFAHHYGVGIIPARPRKPKDKAKVEAGVLLVTRWILAVLRRRTFFSLEEANAAIRIALKLLNDRPFQKLPGCRQSAFQELDFQAARPLPFRKYVYAQVLTCRVNIDYHVDLMGSLYSVPHGLRGEKVLARVTESTVEILHNNHRICSHVRRYQPGYSTIPGHLPKNHQGHLEWSAPRLISWASSIGTATATLVEELFKTLQYEEQGYRQCLGIMRLAKRYTPERVEAACDLANQHRLYRYRNVKNILESGKDIDRSRMSAPKPILHEFVRGGSYYQSKERIHDDEQCHTREPARAETERDDTSSREPTTDGVLAKTIE